MDPKPISDEITVSPQIAPSDVAEIAAKGYRAIICNRPDGEGADQPSFEEIEAAAKAAGLEARYLPVTSGKVRDEDADDFGRALMELPGPVFAYCRTGTRSATLWSLSQAQTRDTADILAKTKAAGYDMAGVVRRIVNGGKTPTDTGDAKFDVVIVGAGAGGIAVAASLKSRKPGLSIALLGSGRYSLLPARLDHGGRRYLRRRNHGQDHGLAHPAGGALDQVRRRRL